MVELDFGSRTDRKIPIHAMRTRRSEMISIIDLFQLFCIYPDHKHCSQKSGDGLIILTGPNN